MGYFSNSTEGHAYEARWCERCVHSGPNGKPCQVWGAHLLYAYGAEGKTKEVLDLLIPRAANDLSNNQCSMFVTVEDVKRKRKERVQTSLPLALPAPAPVGEAGQIVEGKAEDGMVYLTVEFPGHRPLPGVGALVRLARDGQPPGGSGG